MVSTHINSPAHQQQGFFAMYFGSWKVFFQHFLLFWGIAVIFLVPLSVMELMVERNVVAPFSEPFGQFMIAFEDKNSPHADLSEEKKQELIAELDKVVAATQENFPQHLFLLILNLFIQVVGYFLMVAGLFYCAWAVFAKKTTSISQTLALLRDKFQEIISIGWRLFIHLYVLIFVGFIFQALAFLSFIKNSLPSELLSPLSEGALLRSALLLTGGLGGVAGMLMIVGVIVLFVRFHRAIFMLPLYFDRHFKPVEIIEKTKEFAKGMWGVVVFDTFVLGICQAILLSIISAIFVTALTPLYLGIGPQAIVEIARMNKVTFLHSIFPVLLKSVFVPVTILFFYSLYRNVALKRK